MIEMDLLEFTNKHFCLNKENLSDLLSFLKLDYKGDFAYELENMIYAYHIHQLIARRKYK